MAVYRPDPELFSRQLKSIQRQSLKSFECLIAIDGDRSRISALVNNAVGGDERFRVLGFDKRVGFYANFERALAAADPKSAWVAMSDQDDEWYPEKLETLLPELRKAAIVSGQARVVEYPSGRVLRSATSRRNVSAMMEVLQNQFSGALSVFRREVLDLALPFPRLSTPVEVHDHWIAVCAAFSGGARTVTDVVQDYVQHEGNVIGEVSSTNRFNPFSSLQTVKGISSKYEGIVSLRAMLRAIYKVGAGWRQQMIDTLADRMPMVSDDLAGAIGIYGKQRNVLDASAFCIAAARHPGVEWRSCFEYLASEVASGVLTVMGDRPRVLGSK